jgi:hypothetical protein
MKLLDVYRSCDVTEFKIPVDCFEEVSVFLQESALEPFALSAPIAEEAVIMLFFLKYYFHGASISLSHC